MKQTIMGHDNCPFCSEELDAATDPTGKNVPNPGDLTICLYCQEICIYGDDMALEKYPEEQYQKLPEDIKHGLEVYRLQARTIAQEIKSRKETNGESKNSSV